MSGERDYVLGTHDEEIERLGLQHRVWRPRASEAWRDAGFSTGQTLLDIGCGPGFASLDLAEIVGAAGRVVAIDRSRRFLDRLESVANQRGLTQLATHEIDLDEGLLPLVQADGAWARWVFAFVRRPRDLMTRVAQSLRPGGVFVCHEYFDYRTWRLAPRCPEMEEFVELVMKAWRSSGGEPDIALEMPQWLGELGFEMRSVRPIVEIVSPSSYVWQWPQSFIDVGLKRLLELKVIEPQRAQQILEAISRWQGRPHNLCITPAVCEMIAVKKTG